MPQVAWRETIALRVLRSSVHTVPIALILESPLPVLMSVGGPIPSSETSIEFVAREFDRYADIASCPVDRGVRDSFADDVDGCSGQCAGGFQAFARDRIDGNCDLDNSTPGIRVWSNPLTPVVAE